MGASSAFPRAWVPLLRVYAHEHFYTYVLLCAWATLQSLLRFCASVCTGASTVLYAWALPCAQAPLRLSAHGRLCAHGCLFYARAQAPLLHLYTSMGTGASLRFYAFMHMGVPTRMGAESTLVRFYAHGRVYAPTHMDASLCMPAPQHFYATLLQARARLRTQVFLLFCASVRKSPFTRTGASTLLRALAPLLRFCDSPSSYPANSHRPRCSTNGSACTWSPAGSRSSPPRRRGVSRLTNTPSSAYYASWASWRQGRAVFCAACGTLGPRGAQCPGRERGAVPPFALVLHLSPRGSGVSCVYGRAGARKATCGMCCALRGLKDFLGVMQGIAPR